MIIGELSYLREQRKAKQGLTEKKPGVISSFIKTITPYIIYYIPLTLGLIPIATFLSSAGMEFMGTYNDFGFSQELIKNLFESNIANVSFWPSFISSIMFTATNTPSFDKNELEEITATIVNAMICGVFFMLPLGLNAVVWALGWPSFLNRLLKAKTIVVEGEEKVLPEVLVNPRIIIFSIAASLALYFGLIR